MTSSLKSALINTGAAKSQHWDVVIIGSGIGGGSAAHALAHKGLKVLLVEKGLSDISGSSGKSGTAAIADPDLRLKDGRWPVKLDTRIDGKDAKVFVPLGCGLGGSSKLYAAALSRLEPLDFEQRELPDGRSVSWPIRYEDLEPYYERAEDLYGVTGSPDPLSPQSPWPLKQAPRKAPVDEHFVEAFQAAGLHPYDLHIGVKYAKADCDGCPGRICRESCKQDSVVSCIEVAAQTGALHILDKAEVTHIEADEIRVSSITIEREGESFQVSATQYVLSAGGYFTPAVLQRSRNAHWPNGVGNTHDMVGRNLMFHISEHIGIWPRGTYSNKGPRKSISLRDFYEVDGTKYGEFQSVGLEADKDNVLYYLRTLLEQSPLRRIPLLGQFLRIPAYIGGWLFKQATVFACILEDFPYLNNRIAYDASTENGIRVEYTIHDELVNRIRGFRKLLKRTMKTHRMFPMTASVWLNYGHPCGSCRSGHDPQTSVVDAECKVHGIDNLYIADSSTMPTSGGSNPSLTIAANALRVADIVSKRLSASTKAA